LLNSLWLMLPSPFESMAEKSFSSVCDRLEELLVPLLPFVPLAANSELRKLALLPIPLIMTHSFGGRLSLRRRSVHRKKQSVC
jgi:hypothetical protein